MPTFLSSGFRPFFLGAATLALLNMLIWLGYLTGNLEIHSQFEPVYWHLHEMMFGFIGAAIAGFLLTAVPNWTGRPGVKGLNLASLAALWLMGRVAVFYSEYTGGYFAAIADLPLFFIFSLYMYREISAQGSKRNLPIVILIFSFGLANALMHAENIWDIDSAQYGYRLSILLVAALIMLIGGRIIPNFTTNWLKQNGGDKLPTLMNGYDLVCAIWSIVSLFSWVIVPEFIITGYLLAIAGILNLIRLSRWQMLAIIKQPILLILQIGYLWLSIGIFALGVFNIFNLDQSQIPVHIITIGAFSTMILGVMSRASLGHTGRKIIASKLTIGIYICINLSIICRVLSAYSGDASTAFLHISATAWILSFGLFLLQYAPYFFTARK